MQPAAAGEGGWKSAGGGGCAPETLVSDPAPLFQTLHSSPPPNPPPSNPPPPTNPLPNPNTQTRKFATEQYAAAGLTLHREANPTSVVKQPDGRLTVRVLGSDGGHYELPDNDVVFMATGRAPNTKNLGLEAAGVTLGAFVWRRPTHPPPTPLGLALALVLLPPLPAAAATAGEREGAPAPPCRRPSFVAPSRQPPPQNTPEQASAARSWWTRSRAPPAPRCGPSATSPTA